MIQHVPSHVHCANSRQWKRMTRHQRGPQRTGSSKDWMTCAQTVQSDQRSPAPNTAMNRNDALLYHLLSHGAKHISSIPTSCTLGDSSATNPAFRCTVVYISLLHELPTIFFKLSSFQPLQIPINVATCPKSLGGREFSYGFLLHRPWKWAGLASSTGSRSLIAGPALDRRFSQNHALPKHWNRLSHGQVWWKETLPKSLTNLALVMEHRWFLRENAWKRARISLAYARNRVLPWCCRSIKWGFRFPMSRAQQFVCIIVMSWHHWYTTECR